MSTWPRVTKPSVPTLAGVFGLVLGSLLFQGCVLHRQSSLAAGIAPNLVPQLADRAKLEKLINETNEVTPPAKQLRTRNDEINKIVIAIDNNYQNYKNALYAGRAGFDTFADFVSLALTGATAVTGSAGTKAAFGAAATGVTGAHSSVNKNFFNDQSREALFNVMDSLRAEVLATIQEKEDRDYDHYPMSAALVDLESYYSIGTVTAARNAISAASTSALSNAAPPQTSGLAMGPGPSAGLTPSPTPSPTPAPAPSPTPAPSASPSASPSATPAPAAGPAPQPTPSPGAQAKFADRLKTAIQTRSKQEVK